MHGLDTSNVSSRVETWRGELSGTWALINSAYSDLCFICMWQDCAHWHHVTSTVRVACSISSWWCCLCAWRHSMLPTSSMVVCLPTCYRLTNSSRTNPPAARQWTSTHAVQRGYSSCGRGWTTVFGTALRGTLRAGCCCQWTSSLRRSRTNSTRCVILLAVKPKFHLTRQDTTLYLAHTFWHIGYRKKSVS